MSAREVGAYTKELHKALEKCQFIEETLRMCIYSAVEIARFQLSPILPVSFKIEDFSKLSLGALVEVFSRINNDTTLHRDLKKITQDRNHVVHESLLFTVGELQDEHHMTRETRRMEEIVARATGVHRRVLDVRNALLRALNKVKRAQGTGHQGAGS